MIYDTSKIKKVKECQATFHCSIVVAIFVPSALVEIATLAKLPGV